jgi:hypothetical protein
MLMIHEQFAAKTVLERFILSTIFALHVSPLFLILRSGGYMNTGSLRGPLIAQQYIWLYSE